MGAEMGWWRTRRWALRICVVALIWLTAAAAGDPNPDELERADGLATSTERSRDEANVEVMAKTMEKKRRVNPEPESARSLHWSARQGKATALAAEMEAAAAEAAEVVFAAAEAEVVAAASGTP